MKNVYDQQIGLLFGRVYTRECVQQQMHVYLYEHVLMWNKRPKHTYDYIYNPITTSIHTSFHDKMYEIASFECLL